MPLDLLDYDELDFDSRDELDADLDLDAARFREHVLGDLPARPGTRR